MLKSLSKIYTRSPKQNFEEIYSNFNNIFKIDEATQKLWGIDLLKDVLVEPVEQIEKKQLNYNQIDFSEIEFYEESILGDIKDNLQGPIEGTDFF